MRKINVCIAVGNPAKVVKKFDIKEKSGNKYYELENKMVKKNTEYSFGSKSSSGIYHGICFFTRIINDYCSNFHENNVYK